MAVIPERRRRARLGWGIAVLVWASAIALFLLFGDPAVLWRDGGHDAATVISAVRSVDALAQHVRARPDDARAWVLLARVQARDEDYPQAAQSYERALRFAKIAADPAVWCEYADALAMSQGGVLAGKPAEAVAHALQLAPDHGQALEMAGSIAYEAQDYAGAARHWRRLLVQLPAGVAQHDELAGAIARADRLAATRLPPPRSNDGSTAVTQR